MPKRRNVKTSRKNAGAFGVQLLQDCQCFICDELVKNNGVQIVLGRTPYSNVGLPAKIGQLIGDSFMVVVGVSDTMCARCASLINHLDKLETDARTVKKTLMGYIAAKYQLNHKEICAKIDQLELASEAYQILDHNTSNNSLTKLNNQGYGKKTQQVSLLASNQTKTNTKILSCEHCIFSTIDSDEFLTHSSICLKPVNQCTQCEAQLPESSIRNDELIETHSFSGTCTSCSLSFNSANEYSKHMAIHIVNYEKCGICGWTSSHKESLKKHVVTHGTSVFLCSLCPAMFNVKTALAVHISNHLRQRMCLKCSAELLSQSKMLSDCKMAIVTLAGANHNDASQVESKIGNRNDLITVKSTEPPDRTDACGPSSSNIEFHSCPSCGLTFLNKLLFYEHMKMHDEPQNQDQVDISNAHEEVLKSAAVSVAGDCSIDDDLEDLFEKLHAETTNSISSDQSDVLKTGSSKENERSDLQCHLNSENVILSAPSAVESISFCGASSTPAVNEIPQIPRKLITHTKETLYGKTQALINQSAVLPQNNLNNSSSSVSIPPLNVSSIQTGNDVSSPAQLSMTIEPDFMQNGTIVGDFMNQDSQESLNSIFDSQQQTFIYISNVGDNLSDCNSEGMVLHNATIDPESGDIHLLPFVLNDTLPSSEVQSPLMECESGNSGETQIFEQNFCEMKPEPGLATNKLAVVEPVEKDALSCEYCSFQTSIELVLKRHLKIHQGNLVHKCSICNRVFSSTQRLLSHLDLHHKGVGPVQCSICAETFDDSINLRGHLAENHPVEKHNISCRFCGEKFSTKKACISHEETHSEIFRFWCKICSKRFMSEDDLDDHVKWDHDKAGQCRFCGKHIDKPKALRNHELRHMQESNHHECQVCKRVFKTKTGLRHHSASHTGQFKFCCDFCGRGFMSRMMLEEHRSCHTKEERYVCDVCGQKFSFQSTYWIHRKWHETPYPYKCNFCGRFFKHSSLLAVHKRKHTGERPYKCPHCPLSFPVGGTLKRHIILHTGVYPFNCDVCKQGFTARHKYASHLAKVHGIKESFGQKISHNDSMVIVPEQINDDVKHNDLGVNELKNEAVSGSAPQAPSVDSGDIFMHDPNLPSRVVEIVLDESYQAVATVTLADVVGNETTIPDIWYG